MTALLMHACLSLAFWCCLVGVLYEAHEGAMWPEGPGRLRSLVWAALAAVVFYADAWL